ncbi:helix-turn-helix domain-containing protein [Salinicoccus luteus]|uniref:helix-turn-helix domain-containing protein n=1 Tax=Salinicoccus luteus TaxID=367840 RepID=UPI0004E1AB25|nr:helix-turn-helix transcriptional regulator [Salinicoccus luteus]
MVDTLKLKELLIEKNMTQEKVAAAIGMDCSTFSRKLDNRGDLFTIGKIQKMVETIPLSKEEAASIFLTL